MSEFGQVISVVILLLVVFFAGATLMIWIDEQRGIARTTRPMRPYHMARRKR